MLIFEYCFKNKMPFAIQNLSRSLVLWRFSISTAPLRDLSYPLSRSWSFWPYEGWHGCGHISLFSAERKDSHTRGSRLCFWLSLSLWSLVCYVQPILFILYLPAPLLFPLRKRMVWKSSSLCTGRNYCPKRIYTLQQLT